MGKSYENQEWWGHVWKGLVDDNTGKHAKRMGRAVWLYLYFVIHADRDTGRLVRTYETISRNTGIPVRTLKDWMTILKKFKYVEVVRKPYSFLVQITNWRSIKNENRRTDPRNSGDERSAENRVEKGAFSHREVRNPASDAENRTSLTISEIRIKGKRKAEPHTSIENIYESNKDIYRVFEFWNSQKIILHREFAKFKPYIQAKLKNYSLDEIIQGVKNYKEVLDSPDHFFSYRWSLDQFLARKNGLDRFLDREAAMREFANRSNRNGNGYWSHADINSASRGKVVL